jgi:hypothetical protein
MIGGWDIGKSAPRRMRLLRDESMRASRRLSGPIRKPFTIIICECGLEQCDRTVRIAKAEYERVRGDPRQFAIFEGHLTPDIEQVVSEGDRFLVEARGHSGRGGPPRGPWDVGFQAIPTAGRLWSAPARVHVCAQSKAGMMYQAMKARMARTMITIAVYLIAAYPARLDDSGSGLWV